MRTCPTRGFSLIELAATFVILGILVTLGMYAYSEFYRGSLDTDAEERLREVAAREQVIAHDFGRYSDHPDDFAALADGLDVVADESAAADEVSVVVGDRGHVGLATRSKSGQCLWLLVAPLLDGGDMVKVRRTLATCHGKDALPVDEAPRYSPPPGPAVTR